MANEGEKAGPGCWMRYASYADMNASIRSSSLRPSSLAPLAAHHLHGGGTRSDQGDLAGGRTTLRQTLRGSGVAALREAQGRLGEGLRQKGLAISLSSIDLLLAPCRTSQGARIRCGTLEPDSDRCAYAVDGGSRSVQSRALPFAILGFDTDYGVSVSTGIWLNNSRAAGALWASPAHVPIANMCQFVKAYPTRHAKQILASMRLEHQHRQRMIKIEPQCQNAP
jgi:hypothetical protein